MFCSLKFIFSVAQNGVETPAKDFIKTIKFTSSNKNEIFPIIELGGFLQLNFDDLRGNEADYYYRIKHFDHDWKPSQLFQNEFLEGYDNLRIDDYSTSFNTLQTYTHYQLLLPNEDVRFKVSGNYLLEIYTADDELAFSRKFCIYESKASVQVAIRRPQNMDRFATHQSIHFSITPTQGTFRNPNENIKVLLLQNYQWDQTLSNLTPQYFYGNTLEYRYELPAQFEGGNEYFFFDTKDLRVSSPNISYIHRADLYESYLSIDIPRLYAEYTYAPDINGNYEIRNIMQPGDPNTHADYSYVYFSLAADYSLNENEIYIYGAFNNFEINDQNKMYYNPALELYEGVLLLKQGLYNYKYVIKKGNSLYKNALSGTHSLAENDYLVLVYYRSIGTQYDALIGIGKRNSFELQN
jgi:hypothetical protein